MPSLRTRKNKSKPLANLDEEQIKARLSAAEATIREIDALEPARVRGKEAATLRRYEQAVELAEIASAELASRDQQRIFASAPVRRAQRAEQDARRAKHKALAPVMGALDFARRRAHPELRGCRLVADRLSPEEGVELSGLVAKQRALLFREDAPPLTEQERARYEALLAIAAGDVDIFTRRRADAAARAKLRDLGEERKVASLPCRVRFDAPGSVSLPRFAVYSWLAHDTAGDWTVADVGALVTVMSCFENRDGCLIQNARYEERMGEPMLVVAGGPGTELRFQGAIGGDSVDPTTTGVVRLRPALVTLARNQWLEVTIDPAETIITLGPRAKSARGERP